MTPEHEDAFYAAKTCAISSTVVLHVCRAGMYDSRKLLGMALFVHLMQGQDT